MHTETVWIENAITPAAIDAIVRKARADRAQVMRAVMVEFAASLKRLVAGFRPIRERVPHKGALAAFWI
jgi:hypothetical protein